MARPTPLTFKAKVIKDESDALKGLLDAEVTADGLTLLRNKKVVHELTGKVPARLKGKQQVVIGQEGERLTIEVIKPYGYPGKLARDLAAFLSDGGEPPAAADYEYPKWLLVLAFLPIGLVAVGGLIGGAIGGGMAGVNIIVAQQEKIPVPLRAVLMIATTAVAAVLWFVVAMFVLGTIGIK